METVKAKTEDKMKKSVAALGEELGAIRTGRASASLFDKISVSYFGKPTPLNQVATISIPEARLVVIQPWDKSIMKDIEKAILQSDLSLNPNNDGKVIRLNIPPLTEQRRKELAKQAKSIAENSRVAIRNIRREANDELKKKQKTKVLRVIGLVDGDKVISWKSSNRKKAKVTGQENGTCLIKAGKKTGKVRITALTASGKKVVFKLRIQSGKVKTKKIRIAKRTVRISLGETFALQPERYPVTSKQKITYKSRNESVAAVTKKGVIRGISEGTTKVVIYSGDCKLKVKVIVG